jgi:cell division protein FtsI/penicillin-binding protein 2
MSPSTRRIVVVGAVLLLAGAGVVGSLVHTMLVRHAVWLERSYRNRWAFRDVPTRRGSICDRDGVPLLEDQPRFALDLDYDAFRRGHPVGNLVAAATTLWPGEVSHRAPDAILAAAQRLLALPAHALHAQATSRTTARDLRFYVVALAASCSGRKARDLARDLLAAVQARSAQTLDVALRVARAELCAAVAARAARLRALSEILRADGAAFDLCELLDKQLGQHIASGGRAIASRTLARRLPFEAAAELACVQEQWRGFLLRPAVTRAPAELVAGLPSLPAVLGQVSAADALGDDARVEQLAEAVVAAAQLPQALPDDLELPDEAVARLSDRAQDYVRSRVLLGGRFGRSGVEAAMEAVLAGQPGLRFVERDRKAREQLLVHTLDVNPGSDVRVTIDVRLQQVLERVLDAHTRGLDVAMAVIDAKSGDVLAVGGRPLQVPGPEGKLVPRATSPAVSWRNAGYIGSLAKPFVLLEQLAAERAGSAQAHADFVPCARDYKPIPGTRRRLQCDEYHGDDGRDPALAVAKSCNVFFFQAAEGLGLDGLRRAYARAGFVDAAGEGDAVPFQRAVPGLSGFARPRLESQGHTLQHVGIGYGVKANVLSVARAYAGLATGRLPTLGVIAGAPRPAVALAIPDADLALVHDGLRRCVTQGTARLVAGLAEFGVHGKTGTAEVNERDENNAWFAGFVLSPHGPTLAFAAVAYTVDDHGKESARMIADFLLGLRTHPDGAALRRRWLEGSEER